MLGLILLGSGISGWIGWLARAIPQSVSAGLRLGLGLLMGTLGIRLMLNAMDRFWSVGEVAGRPRVALFARPRPRDVSYEPPGKNEPFCSCPSSAKTLDEVDSGSDLNSRSPTVPDHSIIAAFDAVLRMNWPR